MSYRFPDTEQLTPQAKDMPRLRRSNQGVTLEGLHGGSTSGVNLFQDETYEKSDVPFTNHVDGTGATPMYELRLLEIPSVGENNQKDNLVTAKYYRSTLPGSHPLVIVLPIWGSFTYPPRKFTSSFQRRSNGAVHVLHVQGDHHLADWPGLVAAADESEFLEPRLLD